VAKLWVTLRAAAEDRLVELQVALAQIVADGNALKGIDRKDILKKAAAGEVLVLDVRPSAEYAAAHLPHARSLPLGELKKRVAELPRTTPVVAYCRGPFCLMARDAVELLRKKGYNAFHLTDGVAEWRARGLPVEA
jgi:rhodanese-related sulfurtransferase